MTLGIGIVGAGFMSRTYAYGIRELVPAARTVAVTGGTRAPALAADFEAALEPSLEALLARDDVDIVLLGSPTQGHRDQTLAAAAAGKHVFTEKPIAATLPEIDDMIRATREAGVLLGVNAVTRYRQGIRMAKELLDAGEIGEIRMVRHTYAFPATGYADPGHWINQPGAGSPFLDQGAHCNDAHPLVRRGGRRDRLRGLRQLHRHRARRAERDGHLHVRERRHVPDLGELRVGARARDRQDDRLPVRRVEGHARRRVPG